jgi:hypothetical protein
MHAARLGDHRNSNNEAYHIRIGGIEHEAQMFERVEVHLLKASYSFGDSLRTRFSYGPAQSADS